MPPDERYYSKPTGLASDVTVFLLPFEKAAPHGDTGERVAHP
jgi:hypothetical protein